MFVDILRIGGVISFEFFSRCVTGVAYVDIPCVVSVAEDFAEGKGGPPPNGGNFVRLVGVPPPNGGNFVRLVERGVPPPNGGNFVRLVGVPPPSDGFV